MEHGMESGVFMILSMFRMFLAILVAVVSGNIGCACLSYVALLSGVWYGNDAGK